MQLIKNKNSRDIVAFVGGGLAVLVGAGWAVFEYLSGQVESSISVEATYQVCVGDLQARCPDGSVWLGLPFTHK